MGTINTKKLTPREILVYLAIKNSGNWENIYFDIANKIDVDYDTAMETIKTCDSEFITIFDDEYPVELKQICKQPFVLFYKGNINLIKNIDENLTITGTRTPTKVGEAMVKKVFSKALGKNLVIGSSRGLNGIVKQCGDKTIGVLGYGINYDYDKELHTCDLLISEYPNFTQPSNENFMARTRIMVGLGKNLLVLESHKYGSAIPMTTMALEQGKDVLVIPNSPLDEESINNRLIYEGAIPITTYEQLVLSASGY